MEDKKLTKCQTAFQKENARHPQKRTKQTLGIHSPTNRQTQMKRASHLVDIAVGAGSDELRLPVIWLQLTDVGVAEHHRQRALPCAARRPSRG